MDEERYPGQGRKGGEPGERQPGLLHGLIVFPLLRSERKRDLDRGVPTGTRPDGPVV